MAAPSAHQLVTINVGVVWRLQLDPRPPKPQKLSGVVYFKDCPQQPNIPNYLLGLALIHLLMVLHMNLPHERDAHQQHQHPGAFKACLALLGSLFIFMWILAGCNVENASYGLTVCAERTAIQRAVVEGHRQFTAIAVTCDVKDRFVGPCGACRQVLMEFGSDWIVYLTKPDGSYKETSLSELLPFAFSAAHLEKD
ncbi:hypothetical protein PAMP_015787 [Pampus punctatissimus]